MSAWSIGYGNLARPNLSRARDEQQPPEPKKARELFGTAFGTFAKWIPSEVVVGYGAAVAALQPKAIAGQTAPSAVVSWTPWLVGLAGSAVLVLIGAIAKGEYRRLFPKVLLAMAAFGIWSASVPHSVWTKLSFFELDSPNWIFGFALAAVAFALLAEAATETMPKLAAQPA